MLFDLRGRGRRRTVQGIYLMLALLMGGGLVFFGIGGATSGGLLDAFKSGGGGSSSKVYEKQVKTAQRQVDLRPQDPAAWANLTRVRYQAATGMGYDQTTGAFSAKGRQQLAAAGQSWDKYLALNPKKPDDSLASLMVQGYGPAGLDKPAKAVEAMEVLVGARPPSAALYGQLAQLAYMAGQSRKGDLASDKAVSLAPKDQRASLRDQLKGIKQQALSQAAQQAQTTG
jgi:hypothetical protein